eukprot:CAMPEP_0201570416 /NCGR_PEP_ID=MMETSP0190_2-20130828/12690_1 /ASSEMBLY_ACC=CAM_ASM_000263 /TAXON_ID=37353 /ORGANISM="Rosalina sp." /LENGTH=34 /DNA_ID= /DNA_START= /DNA_END= /DNA_ORIENTATION=
MVKVHILQKMRVIHPIILKEIPIIAIKCFNVKQY